MTSRVAGDTLASSPPACVRVLTYNIHGFVGTDRVYDPERVARVIEASAASIVALQEVDFGRGPTREPAAVMRLAERLRMQCHFTSTRAAKNGSFGNAVLTRHAFELVAEGTLPQRRDEARAVQWLKVLGPGFQLHLMNTHLSVRPSERRAQVKALVGAEWAIQARSDAPVVVCGDFNASPWSGVYRKLCQHLKDVQCGTSRPVATWPAALPFWRIDHMFVSGNVAVQASNVLQTALARVASDHLPLVAELALPSC